MGFKQGIRALLFFTATLASVHTPAAVLENLYQVQLTQEEGQSRNDALRAATVLMFQRLAGNDLDVQREPIVKALEFPQELMSRIGTADDDQLRIQFEPAALSRVLTQAGQAQLGPNRPGIVLWAVEAGELGDRPLSPVSPQALLLKQAAQHRGVALSFPLGDLQDMGLISEQVIRQADRDKLLEASERYPVEGTLALVVSGAEDNTELQWNLWLNEEHRSGRTRGTATEAADELMQELANQVFSQYAIPAAAAGAHTEWQLQVDGVDGVAAYSGLMGMLRRLGTQQQPQILEIEADRVVLKVSFPGTEEQLERMLNLDMRLQRVPEPVPQPEPQPQPQPEPAMLPGLDDELGAAEPVSDATASPDTAAEPVADETVTEPATPLQEEPELATPALPAEPELPTLYFRWRG